MEEVIFTKIYHGGSFSKVRIPTYLCNNVPAVRCIDKDHFSKCELLCYTKELGYGNVVDFYYQDLQTKEFVVIKSDQHLLDLIKDLKHEDTFEVFVDHGLDEPLVDNEVPVGYLTTTVGVGEAVDVGGESEANDTVEENEVDLDSEFSDFLSSDSDLQDVPLEDGSDVDEELRVFREERRTKKQRKKMVELEEIPVGEPGGIDKGFEDIVKDKTNKYTGKLGGDEEYLDSSDCWSDDSEEHLDVDAIRGVDLPAKRRSKKVRFDEDCEEPIFELGMVFECVNQFRKAVADYAVKNRRQLKLRPNERHRVRVKCKKSNCKWLLFASIDKGSGNFIVKNYHPVHKCIPLNRNKLCDSKNYHPVSSSVVKLLIF